MPIVGDFADLDLLIDKFGDLEGAEHQAGIARNLAEEALELVAQGFEDSEDPYGNAWESPLVARSGQVLRDTSYLANSWHVHDVQPESFTIKAGVWYAVVHQEGMTITPKKLNKRKQKRLVFPVFGTPVFATSVTIPQRRMVPDANDIPVGWIDAFDDIAEAYLVAYFG